MHCLFNQHNNPTSWYTHFSDENTEAWRDEVTCSGHRASKWWSWDPNSGAFLKSMHLDE